METSQSHSLLKSERLNNYTAYSIGSFVAWAVLWVVLAATLPNKTLDYIAVLFMGWVIGWASATIARLLYPPPKLRRPAGVA
jgi:flagellar biosynthesis protein FliR